jgi:hypothetical protein
MTQDPISVVDCESRAIPSAVSRITVELRAGTQDRFDLDPASQYELMVVDTPGAKATTVLGAPAMTIPRDSSGPALVDVAMQGERVVIYEDHAPLEVSDLLGIAETLS